MRYSPNGVLTSVLLTVLLLCVGCSANHFEMEFSLPQNVNTTYRLEYYASSPSTGFMVETVVAVNAGKGKISCPAKNPSVLFLFSNTSKMYPLVIWVEKGDKIKISGQDTDPFTWTIKGNRLTQKLNEWTRENASALRSADAARINQAVAKYVKGNPSEKLSALLLLTYYSRREDEDGFARLWNSLEKKADKDKIAATVGRIDISLTEIVAKYPPLPTLTLHTLPAESDTLGTIKYDTIRPAKAKATLLYFWDSSANGRADALDSLGAIGRQYSGRNDITVADICLEPDSSLWISYARRDSIAHTRRLWMPAGPADSRAIQAGLHSPGFFIVVNSKGEQMFRGRNASEALSELRRLAGK